MKLKTALKYSPAAILARAANVRPRTIGTAKRIFGIPGAPGGLKLGNMPSDLSDYINTPGTPGSSTFFLYGLGQDEDVVSDSPSFWESVNQVLKTTAEAAKTIVPAVLQAQQQKAASEALAAGRITPYQYQQVASTPVATVAIAPSAGLVRGMGIGGIVLLAAAGIGAFFLLRRR